MRFSHHKKDMLWSIELRVSAYYRTYHRTKTAWETSSKRKSVTPPPPPMSLTPQMTTTKLVSSRHSTPQTKRFLPSKISQMDVWGMPCGCMFLNSSVFLTVKKSAQGSSLLFAQKKLLLNNNLWVLTCQWLLKNWCWLTPRTKVHPFPPSQRHPTFHTTSDEICKEVAHLVTKWSCHTKMNINLLNRIMNWIC